MIYAVNKKKLLGRFNISLPKMQNIFNGNQTLQLLQNKMICKRQILLVNTKVNKKIQVNIYNYLIFECKL
jgi:hypothetical protein